MKTRRRCAVTFDPEFAPQARAIGVKGNCLVEAEVSFIPFSYPGDEGSADTNTSAIDIAHAIMDRLGAPS